MDSEETPAEAALREADEECMLDPKLVLPRGMYSDEHGGWAYHTVLAQAAEPLRVVSDSYEADEAVWLPAAEVDRLDLHPGFADSWPLLREALAPVTVFVDGTGSTGTRASGRPRRGPCRCRPAAVRAPVRPGQLRNRRAAGRRPWPAARPLVPGLRPGA